MTSSFFSIITGFPCADRQSDRAPKKITGEQTASTYLVNPLFDLLFVCGGIVLLLTLLCLWIFQGKADLAAKSTPVAAIGLFGSYLIAEPHTGATLARLYGERENRSRFPLVAYWLPALLAIAFFAALYFPAVARLQVILYLILVWHHYMSQSYGIALMYCARAGRKLDDKAKFLPRAIVYLTVLTAAAQQFTHEFQRSSFLNISLAPLEFLPPFALTILRAALLVMAVSFVLSQTSLARKKANAMPQPAIAVLLTGAIVVFCGRSLSDLVWLFLPNFFHGSQYLAVSLAYQLKKRAESNSDHSKPANFSPAQSNRAQSRPGRSSPVQSAPANSLAANADCLWNCLCEYFLIGLALFTVLPFLISRLGFPFYLVSTLVFLALAFHHFAADACIWRLRNKTVYSRLLP